MTAHIGSGHVSRLAHTGVAALPTEEGMALFDAALAASEATLVAARIDAAGLREQAAAGELPAVLRGLAGPAAGGTSLGLAAPAAALGGNGSRPGGNGAAPGGSASSANGGRRAGTGAAHGASGNGNGNGSGNGDGNGAGNGSALDGDLGSVSREEQQRILVDLVRSHAAAVLRLGAGQQIGPDQAFNDVGFDSLTAVELRNRLNQVTGLRLPSTVAFRHGTPTQLAERLYTELFGGEQPGGQSEAPASTPAAEPAPAGPPAAEPAPQGNGAAPAARADEDDDAFSFIDRGLEIG
jgi:hypothetical protein